MARIILIDDDPESRAMLDHALFSAGHVVFTADDGKDGLALCRVTPVELLITDRVKPGMDGMEAILSFRKEFPEVPIIAMSWNSNLGSVLDTAIQLGALKTLVKPFLPDELLALVKALLPPSRSGSPSVASEPPKP